MVYIIYIIAISIENVLFSNYKKHMCFIFTMIFYKICLCSVLLNFFIYLLKFSKNIITLSFIAGGGFYKANSTLVLKYM